MDKPATKELPSEWHNTV